jgi:hypothetical protein
LLLALLADPAATSDEAILAEPRRKTRRVRVEDVRARMTFFDQYGRGYQSKAGPPEGPGSERLFVWQPALSTTLRQRDERFSHSLSFVLDIVSAASTDALDAVSSASRENEAGTFDNTSSFQPNSRDKWSVRYGLHFEEPWRSGFGGFGYSGNFNDNNTTFSTSINFVYDYFDDLQPRGWNDGQTHRYTLNDNLSLTQVLSPTTLAIVSYGLTFQLGTLENGWNSVYIRDAKTYGCWDDPEQARPYDCPNRQRDNWPRTRTRHAIALQLNQHIPRTRSTLKGRYRHYRDDFQLQAHTGEAFYYQWMGRRFYLRLGYRLHWQSGVGFYTQSITEREIDELYYTADSDLQGFYSHQGSVKGVIYITPPNSAKGGASYLDLGYARYERTNDLHMNVFSLGYAKEF